MYTVYRLIGLRVDVGWGGGVVAEVLGRGGFVVVGTAVILPALLFCICSSTCIPVLLLQGKISFVVAVWRRGCKEVSQTAHRDLKNDP